jgi:anthranilate/para-aminobenzoate synthase component I
MVYPSKRSFLETVKVSGIPPLFREIPFASPCETYRIFARPESFLLESVKGPEKISRYSYIGFDPCLVYRAKNARNEIEYSRTKAFPSAAPLGIMKHLAASYKQRTLDLLPAFQGGLAGMLSYDFVQYIEKIPRTAPDDLLIPDVHLFVVDRLIAFDNLLKKAWIICCPGVGESMKGNPRVDWEEEYDKAESRIEETVRTLDRGGPPEETGHTGSGHNIGINYEMKKSDYIDIVKKAKEYIASGDIFQANLSQRVSAYVGTKDPLRLYEILRTINPSPFAGIIDFGDYQIISSSPERLVRTQDGIIETRPIAGTRPRGKDRKEDDAMRAELLLNEKERAEHIMLIDLERNDLGRVSEYSSIHVDERMLTEDYSHVIHIVSNIAGRLVSGKDCFDAIRAVFPGGTITGVPKVRCMEIIDELEPVRRGPYTGSMGYIGFCGNMDLNIIIRSYVIKDSVAYVQAGAGIVADSDPEREYSETLKKAEALIKTLKAV